MHRLLGNLKIQIPEQLYQKDPESSEVGKKIVKHSIDLIEELGFEAFTFKKLGLCIGSPESTIYRYFENKHMLLLYLSSWYWAWLEYKVVFATVNVDDVVLRLQKAIQCIAEEVQQDHSYAHINEEKLQGILISESSKAFLTKEVDLENKQGYFRSYKSLCQRLADLLQEINPRYAYPHTLVSLLLEGTHQQKFFSQHLPGLTDIKENPTNVACFFEHMILTTLRHG